MDTAARRGAGYRERREVVATAALSAGYRVMAVAAVLSAAAARRAAYQGTAATAQPCTRAGLWSLWTKCIDARCQAPVDRSRRTSHMRRTCSLDLVGCHRARSTTPPRPKIAGWSSQPVRDKGRTAGATAARQNLLSWRAPALLHLRAPTTHACSALVETRRRDFFHPRSHSFFREHVGIFLFY